jgi:hypothetical protein
VIASEVMNWPLVSVLCRQQLGWGCDIKRGLFRGNPTDHEVLAQDFLFKPFNNLLSVDSYLG